MSVKASAFVQAVIAEYEHGCGYIWGMTGQTWTEALQRKGSKQNNTNTQAYGRRWLGWRVYDCSGLPHAMLKALGVKVPHGCNSIYDRGYLSEKGKLAAFPPEKRLPGMAVFLADGGNEHHMGTYIGGGWVIEAYGTQTGVVISTWDKWDKAGYYKDLDYDLPADWTPPVFHFELTRPGEGQLTTLRKGDAGPSVRYLQLLMLRSGQAVTVNHYFDAAVQRWVRAFQQQHGLTVDGIVGPKTWRALEDALQAGFAETTPTDRAPIQAAGASLADALAQARSLHSQLGEALDAIANTDP